MILTPFENLLRKFICYLANLHFDQKLKQVMEEKYINNGVDFIDCLQGIE
jgi:hypothetical protein